MVDKDIKENKISDLAEKQRNISEADSREAFKVESAIESKEVSQDEKRVEAELKRELDIMQMDENAKAEIEKAKEKIEYLGEKEKIEHLLQTAREKGLVFAIQLARKMNEPYLLDVLHDTLAKEGFYKDFISGIKKDED